MIFAPLTTPAQRVRLWICPSRPGSDALDKDAQCLSFGDMGAYDYYRSLRRRVSNYSFDLVMRPHGVHHDHQTSVVFYIPSFVCFYFLLIQQHLFLAEIFDTRPALASYLQCC